MHGKQQEKANYPRAVTKVGGLELSRRCPDSRGSYGFQDYRLTYDHGAFEMSRRSPEFYSNRVMLGFTCIGVVIALVSVAVRFWY
jgi:hypothetical protein